MLVDRCSSQLSGHRLQGNLKSHSLRAKPRDLQFCKPVLEMFFDRVLMQVEAKVCRACGARTMLEQFRFPSPSGLG